MSWFMTKDELKKIEDHGDPDALRLIAEVRTLRLIIDYANQESGTDWVTKYIVDTAQA